MQDALLEPLFLFFAIGVVAGLVKSDIRLPDAVYQLLSTYLLLAIGLKGGVMLSESGIGAVWKPALGTVALGIIVPILGYGIARFAGRMDKANAAALAAHYGSASAVTFAVALTVLQKQGVAHEGFMPVLLVVLELPAILIALFLYRQGNSDKAGSYATTLHEVLVNRSVFLLLAGLLVGWIAGPERFAPYRVLFVDAFRPVLAFFILEMGLLAADKFADLRSRAAFVGAFAVILPVISATLAVFIARFCGLSEGGAIILATTAASASYIAAPAAVRLAIPEANTGLCVAAALGVTFPFNISLGLPLYGWMARTIYAWMGGT